jgi:hypothetical protein
VVRDATGFAAAHVYGRSTEANAVATKQMMMGRSKTSRINIAKLSKMLKREES